MRSDLQLEALELPRFTRPDGSAPLVIALEGPNGAGKTTLCRNLARRLGAQACLGIPPAWFSKPFKVRMIRDADWFSSAMFFLSGCCEQMRIVRGRSEPVILMDRSLWSTLAVHAAESPQRLEDLLGMLRPVASQLHLPHLTLVLEASFATCSARIARKRRAARALDQLTAEAGFHAREQAFYRWLARQTANVEFLNVDEANPRQAADQALAIIQPRLEPALNHRFNSRATRL